MDPSAGPMFALQATIAPVEFEYSTKLGGSRANLGAAVACCNLTFVLAATVIQWFFVAVEEIVTSSDSKWKSLFVSV